MADLSAIYLCSIKEQVYRYRDKIWGLFGNRKLIKIKIENNT
jgi:hypothetical protein